MWAKEGGNVEKVGALREGRVTGEPNPHLPLERSLKELGLLGSSTLSFCLPTLSFSTLLLVFPVC